MTKKFILALTVIGIIATMIMAFGMVASADTPTVVIIDTDSGCYASSRASAPVSGDIVFDASFTNIADYIVTAEVEKEVVDEVTGEVTTETVVETTAPSVTEFGFYIYNPNSSNPTQHSVSSTEINSLVAPQNGYFGGFYATVTDIEPENFNKPVYAIPYVVVDGYAYTGEAVSAMVIPVEQGGKWLGPKN